MKTRILIALLLAVVCLCTVLASCGKNPAAPADDASDAAMSDDISKVTTMGDALALSHEGSAMSCTYENAYVYAFEKDGAYWRMTAALNTEQSAALNSLDITEEKYDEKLMELVKNLPITNREDLSGQKLTDGEMNALVGKTGQDLEDDGWTTGYGYNLETLEFFLEKGPFSYTVTFASEQPVGSDDITDEFEVIRPLVIKSVEFTGLGDAATDIEMEVE